MALMGETWFYVDKEIPKNCGIRSFAILDDTLFAGTATPLNILTPIYNPRANNAISDKDIGCEIWKFIP